LELTSKGGQVILVAFMLCHRHTSDRRDDIGGATVATPNVAQITFGR